MADDYAYVSELEMPDYESASIDELDDDAPLGIGVKHADEAWWYSNVPWTSAVGAGLLESTLAVPHLGQAALGALEEFLEPADFADPQKRIDLNLAIGEKWSGKQGVQATDIMQETLAGWYGAGAKHVQKMMGEDPNFAAQMLKAGGSTPAWLRR